MFCRGGSGADGVYRPEYLCQCSHCDREGLHLTTTLPGEGQRDTGGKSCTPQKRGVKTCREIQKHLLDFR